MALERELKFSLLDDYFPSKLELEPVFKREGYRLMANGFHTQTDLYYDDALASLEKAGWALRKRSLKGKTLACLKHKGRQLGDVTEREEIEAEFQEPWPVAIQSKLLSITFRDLEPRLELSTERTSYRIFKDYKELALLAFDSVTAKEPGGKNSIKFSEAELEARGETSNTTLESLAKLINSVIPINPNSSHKLERALVLLSLSQTL